MIIIDEETGIPTEYHCGCNSEPEECLCLDPKNYHPDHLLWIEMSPDGVTHIWPQGPQDGRRHYHPEWQDPEYLAAMKKYEEERYGNRPRGLSPRGDRI